jgi:hypothetical protein
MASTKAVQQTASILVHRLLTVLQARTIPIVRSMGIVTVWWPILRWVSSALMSSILTCMIVILPRTQDSQMMSSKFSVHILLHS